MEECESANLEVPILRLNGQRGQNADNVLEDAMKNSKCEQLQYIDHDLVIRNTSVKLENFISQSLQNATNSEDIVYIFTKDG